MVPVISVACIQDKKHALFLCPSFSFSLHANVIFEASICRLVLQFTTNTQNYCQSDWSFFISPKLVLRMYSIISRNELMIPIV